MKLRSLQEDACQLRTSVCCSVVFTFCNVVAIAYDECSDKASEDLTRHNCHCPSSEIAKQPGWRIGIGDTLPCSAEEQPRDFWKKRWEERRRQAEHCELDIPDPEICR